VKLVCELVVSTVEMKAIELGYSVVESMEFLPVEWTEHVLGRELAVGLAYEVVV